jgi:glycosyltransferase involved in cell wall biosynthesis
MASGMPVVTTNLRGLASLFEQLPGLILVRDSSQVLESAISLANSPNLAASGERNRDEVSKKFDVEGNVLAFEKLLLDVVRVNG